ncbi:MAG: TIGR02285 family protein [Rhodocyclaceae bacterium]|nr:TIGR02285 family protein [Rhodocyclaceae bacterium]
MPSPPWSWSPGDSTRSCGGHGGEVNVSRNRKEGTGSRVALWLAAIVLSAALLPATAEGRETVLWAALDFPPFQIREGESKGSGSFDGLLDLLVNQLGDLDHDVVTMTFARREEEIRRGHQLCTPGLFRTPAREGLLEFSLPALIHLDNRLVFRAANKDRFEGSQPADLDALLKRSDLVGGIVSERSFAPNIDPSIKQAAKQPNLLVRPLKSHQMFELLLRGEIDYTILFPHEAAYLARQQRERPDIRLRPIAGTPPYIFTHVACTKGPWGEAMIGRINQVLLRHQRQAQYRALSERWYDESDKMLIRKYYPLMLTPAAAP